MVGGNINVTTQTAIAIAMFTCVKQYLDINIYADDIVVEIQLRTCKQWSIYVE